MPARPRLVRLPLLAIAGGVVEGLPRVGDGAHERARVGARQGGQVEVQGRRLPQHHRLQRVAAQVEEDALAGQHAFARDDERGRDPVVARLQRIGQPHAIEGERLRREGVRGRSGSRPTAGRRPRRKSDGAEAVHEPGGDGQARDVDDPRAHRDHDAGPHGVDETVAEHDRALLDHGAGDREHAAAHERVDLTVGGLPARGDEDGQHQAGEDRTHAHQVREGPWRRAKTQAAAAREA